MSNAIAIEQIVLLNLHIQADHSHDYIQLFVFQKK